MLKKSWMGWLAAADGVGTGGGGSLPSPSSTPAQTGAAEGGGTDFDFSGLDQFLSEPMGGEGDRGQAPDGAWGQSGTPATPPAHAQETGGGQQPAAPPPLASPFAPPAAVPPAPAPQPGTPEAELATLRAELAELRGRLSAQPQPQRQQPAQQPAQPNRRYDLRITDPAIANELAAGLVHEDPATRVNTVLGLLTHVAEMVHQNVERQWNQEWAPSLRTNVETTVQQRQAATQVVQQIQGDFFGSFPDLNHEVGKALVRTAIPRVVSTHGHLLQGGWNEEFRNALGHEVRAMVARMTGVVADYRPPDLGAGGGLQPNNIPRPTRMTQTGGRPEGVAPNGKVPDHNSPEGIAAALFGP